MIKKVAGITIFNTGEGTRISMAYTEIDETGKILRDNQRVDRLVIDEAMLSVCKELTGYAQNLINTLEE